ncbi:MAG: hypothetical protein JJ866_19595 [Roseibium sp.]|uniref:hypothetical protein n=1 Tax=Roseibium sp. TaxID=1936156 RepID=UPI001B0D5284|nr:hypothetical protein [Roseibium sp.]MBO6894155.1 hypothetical protein [Roseibium sp.]MBO6930687.1 hypothetical protein [Roseibium sp.]
MTFKNEATDSIDLRVRAMESQKAWVSSMLGLDKAKEKWNHMKGPNPLMLQGLDRS